MFRKLLLLWACLLPWQPVLADASVWKVFRGDSVIYLAGTVHLLRPADYPLPDAYDRAYQAADALVLETELERMMQPETQRKLVSYMLYPDGMTLEQRVDPAIYQRLSEYFAGQKLSIELFRRYKPSSIMLIITVLEMQRMGFSQQGVDQYYLTQALQDGKPVQALETLEQQMDYLASIGAGQESELLLYTLDKVALVEAEFEALLQAWRVGDVEQLDQLVNGNLDEFPGLYDSLLVERNNNWMPQLETYLQTPETELVLVGAAHLVGQDGLLKQLEQKGYQVSRF